MLRNVFIRLVKRALLYPFHFDITIWDFNRPLNLLKFPVSSNPPSGDCGYLNTRV